MVSTASVASRLLDGPAALGRSGRRVTQAGLITLELITRAKARFPRPAPENLARRIELLSWGAENMSAVHGMDIVTRGQVPRGPVMLVANHVTYMDCIAIMASKPCSPIAKREVGSWPGIGEVARSLGVLFVERGSIHSGARVLLEARRALELGVSVLAFSEGTTTDGSDVLPMRRGAPGLAARMGIPVVPVALRYDRRDICWIDDAQFFPHYLRTTARPALRAHVSYGDPLRPFPGERAQDFTERTRTAIRQMLRSDDAQPVA